MVMNVVGPIIIAVIGVFIGALLLKASAAIFKVKKKDYVTCLKVTAIVGGIAIVLSLIGGISLGAAAAMGVLNWIAWIVVSLLLIRKFMELEWGKAALVWLVYLAFSFVASLIIAAIVTAIMLAMFGGAMAAGLSAVA